MSHTGAMIALSLPMEVAASVHTLFNGVGGVQVLPDDMHLTIAYLGNASEVELYKEFLILGLDYFSSSWPTVVGTIDGVGRFCNTESDGSNAVFVTCDSKQLEVLRRGVCDLLGVVDLHNLLRHGFTPHITTVYVPSESPTPTVLVDPMPVVIPKITLYWGDEKYSFPLGQVVVSESSQKSVSVVKQSDGHWRWVGFSSTSFKDRDGEIIPEAVLEEWSNWVEKTGEYGTLQWWHTGIDLGTCDCSVAHGPVLIESGVFYDDAQGERASRDTEGFEMSVHFKAAWRSPDGVFGPIRMQERSMLPIGEASNLLTSFGVSSQKKDDSMASVAEKVAKLMGRLGSSTDAETLLTQAEQLAQAGDAAGLERKEVDVDTPGAEAPVAVSAPSVEELVTALTPIMQQMIDSAVAGVQNEVVKSAGAVSAFQESTKLLQQALAAVIKQQNAQREVILELLGEQPRSSPVGRASESEKTLLTNVPGAERVKESSPKSDQESLAEIARWMAGE